MNLDIEQLKITISTNIPNIRSVEFTSSLLYHPDYKSIKTSNKYPYITSTRDYPVTALKGMEYDKIIDFFFNKQTFTKMLTSLEYPPTIKTRDLDKNTIYKKDIITADANTIYKKNIMTMLELVFSTKYFIVNNVHQSLDVLLNQSSSKNIFYNPFTTRFSYLKINNKPYTIAKVVWLNDIVNNPKYRELIEEVHNVKRSIDKNTTDKTNAKPFKLAATKSGVLPDNKELTFFKQSIQPNFSTSIRKSQNYFTPLFRKSSNEFLQKYIDGNDEESTKALFESFENIFNKFIKNNPTVEVDNRLLDIGVDKINLYKKERREKDYPENEIFLLLNLIDGEVNESNKKEIYCPYTDKYLGNMLEKLLYTSPTDNKYIVDVNELSYSIKPDYTVDNKSDNQKPIITDNINVNKPNKPEEKVLNATDTEINDLFFAKIFNINDEKLNPILGEINELNRDEVNEGNILNFLKETYISEFNSNSIYNLYNLITRWNESINFNYSSNNNKSKLLKEDFKKIQNSLTYDMNEINKKIQEERSTNVEKILALKRKLAIIKLYLYIINNLIDNTANQPVITNGGRKKDSKYKRRHKTIKKRRRPNHQRTYKK